MRDFLYSTAFAAAVVCAVAFALALEAADQGGTCCDANANMGAGRARNHSSMCNQDIDGGG
jgi:hypothetical protein